jgi:hypothetical protein
MDVRDGKLMVEVDKPKWRRRRYALEQLVAGIRRKPLSRARMGTVCWQRSLVIIARLPAIQANCLMKSPNASPHCCKSTNLQ